ncbi:MAG: glycosyltransferase family 39 protein [Anaerolineae bacterium]|nr:glycosyltransferase family 39 protein [Phycisphaerae bacterium]
MTATADQSESASSEHPVVATFKSFLSAFDRHFWLALLLAAIVIIPRSALMIQSHSDYYDDQYHYIRGIRFIADKLGRRPPQLNDPPLGEALTAWPVWWSGVRNISGDILYGQKLVKPETLRLRVAIWKSILLLPMIGVAFVWLRRLYGVRSAWLGTIALTFEPSIAAHIPTGAVDVLGVEGIVLGCFFTWLYFEKPTIVRLIFAGASIAVALMLKHTAAIFPAVALAMAMLWTWRDRRISAGRAVVAKFKPLKRIAWRAGQVALLGAVAFIALWAIVRFEVSVPVYPPKFAEARPKLHQVLQNRYPAGLYIGSLMTGVSHADRGAPGYLFGKVSMHGYWRYFPILATYKAPIGLAGLMILGAASLFVVKPKWNEWSLLLPLIAWSLFIINSGINIGWRHFLPPYVFLILLSCRVGATDRRPWQIAGWACIALASIHAALWHPNYLSYFNFPRHKPYLAVSDSNIDWAQSLKQAAEWIDRNPPGDKPIYVLPFARPESPAIKHYIGDRATIIRLDDPVPRSGLLIISSVWESGANDGKRRYRFLQSQKPIAQIGGGAMQVYDLDQIKVPRAATFPATAPQ